MGTSDACAGEAELLPEKPLLLPGLHSPPLPLLAASTWSCSKHSGSRRALFAEERLQLLQMQVVLSQQQRRCLSPQRRHCCCRRSGRSSSASAQAGQHPKVVG